MDLFYEVCFVIYGMYNYWIFQVTINWKICSDFVELEEKVQKSKLVNGWLQNYALFW